MVELVGRVTMIGQKLHISPGLVEFVIVVVIATLLQPLTVLLPWQGGLVVDRDTGRR